MKEELEREVDTNVVETETTEVKNYPKATWDDEFDNWHPHF